MLQLLYERRKLPLCDLQAASLGRRRTVRRPRARPCERLAIARRRHVLLLSYPPLRLIARHLLLHIEQALLKHVKLCLHIPWRRLGSHERLLQQIYALQRFREHCPRRRRRSVEILHLAPEGRRHLWISRRERTLVHALHAERLRPRKLRNHSVHHLRQRYGILARRNHRRIPSLRNVRLRTNRVGGCDPQVPRRPTEALFVLTADPANHVSGGVSHGQPDPRLVLPTLRLDRVPSREAERRALLPQRLFGLLPLGLERHEGITQVVGEDGPKGRIRCEVVVRALDLFPAPRDIPPGPSHGEEHALLCQDVVGNTPQS